MSQAIEADVNIASRLIDRHVQANLGQKRALDYGEKHYSFYDVAALANRAGNLLKARGVRPGAQVLLLMPASPAYIGALIGAMKVGAVPALMRLPEDAQAVAAYLRSAQPALALVHASYLAKLAEALRPLGADNILVVGEAPAGYPSFVELMRAQASSLAAEAVAPDAPALAMVAEQGAAMLSHAALQALIDGESDGGLGATAEALRALAKAQTAQLALK